MARIAEPSPTAITFSITVSLQLQGALGIVAVIGAAWGVGAVLASVMYIVLALIGVGAGILFVCYPVCIEIKNSKLPALPRGVSDNAVRAATSPPQPDPIDRRYTGHTQIDDEINKFLDL